MQEEKYKNEVTIQVIAERINTMQNDIRDLKAMGNDPELTRAMVVGIGFFLQKEEEIEDLCRRIKRMPPFK